MCIFLNYIYLWESEASQKIFEINIDDKKRLLISKTYRNFNLWINLVEVISKPIHYYI